jgi:quinol monooxygenase YgiN
MITVLFSVNVKDGSLDEFQRMAADLTRSSRLDDGCITYTFYRQTTTSVTTCCSSNGAISRR